MLKKWINMTISNDTKLLIVDLCSAEERGFMRAANGRPTLYICTRMCLGIWMFNFPFSLFTISVGPSPALFSSLPLFANFGPSRWVTSTSMLSPSTCYSTAFTYFFPKVWFGQILHPLPLLSSQDWFGH